MKIFLHIHIYLFSLGAVHDGTTGAINCSSLSAYIMTPQTILSSTTLNETNLYLFSPCSVASFKSLLLSPNLKLVIFIYCIYIIWNNFSSGPTPVGGNLLNLPFAVAPLGNSSQIYDPNQQCQLIYGYKSSYDICKVKRIKRKIILFFSLNKTCSFH